MKTLLVIGSLRGGGTERMVARLANGLSARGMEVHLALLEDRAEHAYAVVPEVSVHDLGLTRRNPLRAALRLRTLMRACDVTYSFLDLANVLAAVARPVDRTLVWGLRGAGVEPGVKARVAFALARWLVGRADYCIANAVEAVDAYTQRGFALPETTVIENGIDPDVFNADPERRAEGRAALAAKSGEVLVGHFARANPVKRHDLVVRAARELLPRYPQLRFVFVGRGTETLIPRLANGCERRITALGERPGTELPALVAALDVAVCASDIEGFPNSVLEAMACAVPCVATAAGATAQLVGPAGIVVAVGDGEGLTAAVEQLVCDPELRARLGGAARQRVVDEFTEAQMIDRTFERLSAWARR